MLTPFLPPHRPFLGELIPSDTYVSPMAMQQGKTIEDLIDPPGMEKLEDDGSPTTSPYVPLPSPEIPADLNLDLDLGMCGMASSPPTTRKGSSSNPQVTEVQESIAHPSLSRSKQLPSSDAYHPGHSKDVSTDPPFPEVSKRPQTQSDGIFSPFTGDLNEALDSVHLAKLVLANQHLVEEQQTVSAKRSQVRELRQALKYKREEESNLRTALMRKLNALFAQQDLSTTQPLVRDYEALQLTTEAYVQLEYSYHDAEDQLEQQEYRLGMSMKRFASLSCKGPLRTSLDLTKHTLEDDSPDDSDDASSMATAAQDHPQGIVDYLSRVGDVRLLQEHLMNLDSQWLAIMDKHKQRNPLHLALDDESLEFLRTYDEERRNMWYELNHAQLDVNQLRSICEENGLLTDDRTRNLDFLYPLDSEDSTRLSDDPLKLSVDEGSSFFFEPQATTQLQPTGFINKWLLHQLRNSSVEIHRLKSRPELQPLWDRGFDDTTISRWALREWFSDDAGLSSRPPSTLPPDVDHIPTTEPAMSPEKKSKPVLIKSRSVPLFRRPQVVHKLRHSHSMPFRNR
ncbi:uncharacterized protein KD926_002760 [Aspergillus affinis]|uniref:uncharacterized protein n=1 Tax=Aspergillus affinis TaxID=1070780 RepID=UPI0022FEDEA9|nr:uncharacterized protein KD926_002760 [Aspergillus affinis]KAI9043869.1 hypothetical protein KD926_002760 [Aspergillus affinis]